MTEFDWRNNELRQKVRDQLEQHIKNVGVAINVIEVESQAFENSSSQEDYVTSLKNWMSKFSESGKQRNEKLIQSQRHAQMMAQRGNIVTGPTSASTFMDGTGPPVSSTTIHPNGKHQSNLLQQQLLQQQLQQAGMRTVVQQQQDPINALQHLTKQGVQTISAQPGQQVVRQPNQMPSVLQQRLQFQGYPTVVPGGPRNVAQQNQQTRGDMMLVQQQPTRLQMMTQQGQIMTPGQFVGSGLTPQFHLSVQSRGQHMGSNVQSFNQITGSPGNIPGTVLPQQTLTGQHMQQQMQPSPAGLGGSGMMIPSPSNLNIPSQSPAMQPHLVGLSPSSRMSLSSPSSHVGTPGNPGSIGPAPVGSVQMSAAEEQEYLQKWEQLQKYIEPLKKMISKIDKDEDRKMDMNKMKNLLDILSDRNKRLPLITLLKCESVLERQLQVGSDSSTISTTVPTSGSGERMTFGQDLYDTLWANRNSPRLNQTLKDTFGCIRNIIYMPDIEIPNIKTTRRLSEKTIRRFEVKDVIQLEVALMKNRFIVNIDDSHFVGSDNVVLSCRLANDRLPAVPPLIVHVPKDYPTSAPTVHMNKDLYDSSELFKKVREILTNDLDQYISNPRLTNVLNFWELAVKKSSKSS